MSFSAPPTFRVALLDMNAGHPNQGMRCIRQIVNEWASHNGVPIAVTEFDVRVTAQVPSTDFDVYISSGGPGDPLSSRFDDWDIAWINWLKEMLLYNENPKNEIKKHVFFICHSFQLAARYFNLGLICKRKSTSFGVFPIHMLQAGKDEVVFENLKDPFYAVDSRDFQIIQPNHELVRKQEAEILCIEKSRPHIPLERAIMAIRFNEYMVGTQFHPEADAVGMALHFQDEEKKQNVIQNHGEEKYKSMIAHLRDPDKILFTYSQIIPNFLHQAVHQFSLEEVS